MERLFALGMILAILGSVPTRAQVEAPGAIPQTDFEQDGLMFDRIDQYTRTIERAMAEITRISKMEPGAHTVTRQQEDHYSNKLARAVAMKETAAHAIGDILYGYFLQERLGNWPGVKNTEAGYASKEYRTYTKMLEYLHSATVYTLWCKELTMPGKARAVRSYVAKFRALWEDPTYAATRRGNAGIPH